MKPPKLANSRATYVRWGNEKRSINLCDLREQRQAQDGWFVLVENRWTDRLKILAWSEALASVDETHLACGAAHVKQLVVHWMTMGSLEYPFAKAAERLRRFGAKGKFARQKPTSTVRA
jgi:hypothetical protein